MVEVKAEEKEVQAEATEPQRKNLSIEEVLAQYPIDREKARDVILIDVSRSLMKIADSMSAITEALVLLGKKFEDGQKE